MSPHQIVRFTLPDGKIVGTWQWPGEWPPPQRLALVQAEGIETPMAENHVVELEASTWAVITWFRLKRVSRLPDEAVQQGGHVARGAEYVQQT